MSDDYALLIPRMTALSLCTVSMNRTLYLRQAAKTWVQYPDIKEIVIVDWSSTRPVTHQSLPDDPRIRLYRWDGETEWMAGKAMSAAVRCTTQPYVLKVDSDVKLTAPIPKIPNKGFFRGVGTAQEDGTHLYGCWMALRSEFDKVNGYNERYKGWGHEDSDLYTRLVHATGKKKVWFPKGFLEHVPHDRTIGARGGMFENYKRKVWTPIDTPFDQTRMTEVPRG